MPEQPFNIEALPGTYIWRQPTGADVFFNVPIRLFPVTKLSDFGRARVSISAKHWRVRADHGGLLLAIRGPGASTSSSPLRWLRVGPELCKDGVMITVTGCDRFADQSLHPLDPEDESEGEITVELRKETSGTVPRLWVYYLVMTASGQVLKRHPLRQITWFFDDEDRGLDLEIGAFAARPAIAEIAQGEPLTLRFRGLILD